MPRKTRSEAISSGEKGQIALPPENAPLGLVGGLKGIRKRGRPSRQIDHAELARLGGIGLTFQQAAAVMRIPRKTLSDRVHGISELEDAFLKGRAMAIGELSGMLWDHARNGNVIAAIFLAKSYGWRENGPVSDVLPQERGGSIIILPQKDQDTDL